MEPHRLLSQGVNQGEVWTWARPPGGPDPQGEVWPPVVWPPVDLPLEVWPPALDHRGPDLQGEVQPWH
ncbi:unnamed protein product [Arctogadus glacialis]